MIFELLTFFIGLTIGALIAVGILEIIDLIKYRR